MTRYGINGQPTVAVLTSALPDVAPRESRPIQSPAPGASTHSARFRPIVITAAHP